MRLLYFLLLLYAVCSVSAQQQYLAPIATYEQSFEYSNGQISVNQTAQLALSDTLSGGLLRVGETVIRVQAHPPVFKYRAQKVGAIPKSTTLHTEEVCVYMGDKPTANADVSTATVLPGTTATRRRLLQSQSNFLIPASVEKLPTITPAQTENPTGSPEQIAFWKETCKTRNATEWLQRFDSYVRQDSEMDLRGGLSVKAVMEPMRYDLFERAKRKKCCIPPQLVTRFGENIPDIADANAYEAVFFVLGIMFNGYLDDELSPLIQTYRMNDLTIEVFRNTRNAVECASQPGICYSSDLTGQTAAGGCNIDQAPIKQVSMAVKALAITTRNALTSLSDQVNTALQGIKDRSDAIANFSAATGVLAAQLNNFTIAQDLTNKKLLQFATDQASINSVATARLNVANDQINQLWSATQNFSNSVDSRFSQTIAQVDLQLGTVNNNTDLKVRALGSQLAGLIQHGDDQIRDLYNQILELGDGIQSVSGALYDFVRQKQYRRLLVRSFFASVDELTSNTSSIPNSERELPLVSADGIKPSTLSGVDLGAFIDTVSVSYTMLGGKNAYDRQFTFYADTNFMLDNARPWTTIQTLLQWIGPATPCLPPSRDTGTDSTAPTDDPRFNSSSPFRPCRVWATENLITCKSINADPVSYSVSNPVCNGTKTSNTTIIYDTATLLSRMTVDCNTSMDNNLLVVDSAQQGVIDPFINNSTYCSLSIRDRITLQANGGQEILTKVLLYLIKSFTGPFQTVLQGLELKKYGRLPAGIKTEMTSMGYTPGPSVSGTYDGGSDSVSCMRGYWLSVSQQTLDVTSLAFDSTSTLNDDVDVSIETPPPCSLVVNQTDPACYSVRDADLRTNFVFTDGREPSLPSTMVVVGDISVSHESGAYDVPESLIQTTQNSLVRTNLLTYLLMPPGTTTTLPYGFFAKATGGLFDAYAGSASAEDYRLPALLDNDGYAVCNIAGGLPSSGTFIATENNCVVPFVWSGAYYTSANGSVVVGAPPVNSSSSVTCSQQPAVNTSALLFSEMAYGTNMVNNTDTKARVVEYTSPHYGAIKFSVGAWVTMTSQANFLLSGLNVVQSSLPVYPVDAVLPEVAEYVAGDPLDRTSNDPTFDIFKLLLTTSDTGHTYYLHISLMNASPSICLEKVGFDWECYTERRYPFKVGQAVHLVFTFDVTKSGSQTTKVYANGKLLRSADLLWPQYFSFLGGGSAGLLFPVTSSVFSSSSAIVVSGASVAPSYVGTLSFNYRLVRMWNKALSASEASAVAQCTYPARQSRCWIAPAGVNATMWTGQTAVEAAPVVVALHKTRGACLSSTSGTLISLGQPDGVRQTGYVTTVFPVTITMFYRVPFFELGVTPYMWNIYNNKNILLTWDVAYSTQARVYVTVYTSASACVQFTLLGSQSIETVGKTAVDLLLDGDVHHLAFVVTATAVRLWVDGVTSQMASLASSPTGVFFCRVPTTSEQTNVNTTWTFQPVVNSAYDTVSSIGAGQLVTAFSSQLGPSDIRADKNCLLSTFSVAGDAADVSSDVNFVLPLATCSMDGTSSLGYCRHTMMCGGKCSAYSLVDRTALTFTPLRVQCDPGYLPPDCRQKCTRVDVLGNCVTQQVSVSGGSIDGLQTAYSPNGRWCQVLKSYQVSSVLVNDQSFTYFAKRAYKYLTDITTPTGKITSLVAAGSCPSYTLKASGDGAVRIVLGNYGSQYTPIQVVIQSAAPCSAPQVCCSDTYPLSLPPYQSYDFKVPSLCANLAVTIKLNNGPQPKVCAQLNTTSVAALVFQSVTTQPDANVLNTVYSSSNNVLGQIVQANQKLAAVFLQMQLSTSLTLANDSIVSQVSDALDALSTGLPASTINQTGITDVPNPFNNKAAWDALVAASAALRVDAERRNAAQTLTIGQLSDTIAATAAAAAAVTAGNAALQAAVAADQASAERLRTLLSNNLTDIAAEQAANQAQIDALFTTAMELQFRSDKFFQPDIVALDQVTMGLLITGCVLGTVSWFVVAGYLCYLGYLYYQMRHGEGGSGPTAALPHNQAYFQKSPHSSTREVPDSESGSSSGSESDSGSGSDSGDEATNVRKKQAATRAMADIRQKMEVTARFGRQ